METTTKVRQTFSTTFKKEKVLLIAQGKLKVREVCKMYNVSETAVYKWISLYSTLPKTERLVVEKTCEEKKTLELLQKVAELERVVGQQAMQLLYKTSIIEAASSIYGEDIEKKHNSRLLKKV